MKIFLGADHGGVELKKAMAEYLAGRENLELIDLGADSLIENDDYVDYSVEMARKLQQNKGSMGVLFCRNGMGMSIVANRFEGIRCGLGFDKEAVRRGRTDDDINCLAVPADYLDDHKVEEIVDVFLSTDFSNQERYVRRLQKLASI